MIDSQPRRAVRVYQDGGAGPYLMVLLSQLPEVRATLDRHQVFYWVDRTAISLDNKPATIGVNFLRAEDRGKLQAIFDDAG